MASEIFVPVIENRKLQGVNDAPDCINDASGQQPAESCCGHGIEDLCKCKDAGPAHADIQDRGYPLGAIHPECFDQNSDNSNPPYNCQKDHPGSPAQNKQADWCIAACDQDADHHVVDFFQNRADPL